jgi:hypothetical protein
VNLIFLKIYRMSEHLKAIEDFIAADIARYGDRFIVESQGKDTVRLVPADPKIAVRAGELIYQLRSALDHLACELVKANRSGITLPADWEEECQFPIWTDPLRPGQTIPLPYGAFKRLPGIPIEAHTIIERVQPYYPAGTGSVNTSLGLLNELSNIDKHRRFTLMRTRAKVFHRVVYKSGFKSESIDTLDHGAEVPTPYSGEDDPIVDVERSTTLTVAFDEREALGDATLVGVDHLLQGIVEDVVLRVIDPLKPFLT